jgi:hypothetical protein
MCGTLSHLIVGRFLGIPDVTSTTVDTPTVGTRPGRDFVVLPSSRRDDVVSVVWGSVWHGRGWNEGRETRGGGVGVDIADPSPSSRRTHTHEAGPLYTVLVCCCTRSSVMSLLQLQLQLQLQLLLLLLHQVPRYEYTHQVRIGRPTRPDLDLDSHCASPGIGLPLPRSLSSFMICHNSGPCECSKSPIRLTGQAPKYPVVPSSKSSQQPKAVNVAGPLMLPRPHRSPAISCQFLTSLHSSDCGRRRTTNQQASCLLVSSHPPLLRGLNRAALFR